MAAEKTGGFHRGRFKQIPIYFGKFLRMFLYLNDWKVLPMAMLVAAIVAFVACGDMYKTMEGTSMGAMALTCACLWNGCFNSIQVVCRERSIVKREHRSGMFLSSYIMAHMLYQALLCALQCAITVGVCSFAGIAIPAAGFITPWGFLDLGLTLFFITYAADMMSLMLSCIAKNTTAAMTVMPLVLIVQLVFSGILFSLSEGFARFSRLTIAKWGLNCICALSNYNDQPMVTVWNQLVRYSGYDFGGTTPILTFARAIEENGLVEDFCLEIGASSQVAEYARTTANVLSCWGILAGFALLFALLALCFLHRIDRDRR